MSTTNADLSLYPASFRSLHRGRRPGYRLQLQGKGGESSLGTLPSLFNYKCILKKLCRLFLR